MASLNQETPILILDGGLGTTLEEKYHIRFSSAETPLWSSHLLLTEQGQETLLRCHEDFIRGGADIVSTATYQASIAGFTSTHTPDWPDGVPVERIPGFLGDAVGIAGRASGEGSGTVAALSLGPYGATMVPSQEYAGVYDTEHSGVEGLRAWHAERMGLFARVRGVFAGVEYVAFETVPRVDEVIAVRRVMGDPGLRERMREDRGARGEVRYWISCVFTGENVDGEMTMPDGTTARDVVGAMLDLEVSSVLPWGVGINCTKVEKLPALVGEFEAAVGDVVMRRGLEEWPSLVLYPDGTNGEIYNTVTQKWELPEGVKAPTQSWESQVGQVVQSTRRRCRWRSIVVGGCCKTSPADIARLREAVLGDRDTADYSKGAGRP
ncbi:Homocysteine S-methyltransferase [Coniochaeta hoffmannii]|uniref:Homocysteine S-methyltransferase n=1 Tax=Coniochaeta hoffmannii TaxID=91930 RepID=A0AA38R5M1_9PEZI|nr:Homocysteine S-methyltransferase [Coniochaeta hoffmannii]